MKILLRIVVVLSLWTTAVTLRSQANTTSNFSLQKTTEVPGDKLSAGDYRLTVLDRLTDRIVMRVNSVDGKSKTLILGVPAHLSGASGQPVFWDAKEKGRHALRGFVFADGGSAEFVYPKADAVALAKANHSSVVAVDTASEGRPELGKLSSGDMQMVNLWLLTPTRVSGQDALEAKHFEPSGANASTSQTAQASAPSDVTPQSATVTGSQTRASNAGAPTGSQKAMQFSSKPVSASRTSSRSVTPAHNLRASAEPPAGIRRLPQTGSTLPLWFLLTTTCLAGAATLRIKRGVQTAA